MREPGWPDSMRDAPPHADRRVIVSAQSCSSPSPLHLGDSNQVMSEGRRPPARWVTTGTW